VRLARFGIQADYVIAWSPVLPGWTPDQLVYAKQRHVRPDAAQSWRQAGYSLIIEDLYWAKQRHITPEAALAWKKAEYQLSLQELYFAKQRQLDPKIATAW
jgi:hypothetical protein